MSSDLDLFRYRLSSANTGGRVAPTFSFIIPVRNDAVRLRQCLQSIAASKLPAACLEVIVVDNGSTDCSPDVAKSAGARILELPGVRVSELRNRGAAVANGSILAFVDADHEIAPGWDVAALELLSARRVGAVGAPYSAPDPPTWVQHMYDGFRDHRAGTREVLWMGSGNLAVRREVFFEVGGFDRSLEACEDVDFCQRLRAEGYELLADSRLNSTHKGDPPTLRALFQSELWRGRDNLRVSLRGPLSLAALPGIIVPIVGLLCVIAIVLGVAALSEAGGMMAATAAALFVTLSGLRAARLVYRLPNRRPADPLRAFSVAVVYDLARALALTLQIPHRRAGASVPTAAHQS